MAVKPRGDKYLLLSHLFLLILSVTWHRQIYRKLTRGVEAWKLAKTALTIQGPAGSKP